MINKASLMVYGDSGTGKSTLILSLLQYLRSVNRGLRLVLCDFQESETILPFLDSDDVEIVDIAQSLHPFDVLNFLAAGYWPDSKARYVQYSGNDVKDKLIKLLPSTDETWKKVGGWAIDSVTGAANLMMKSLSDRTAKGESIGTEPGYRLTDGELKMAANGLSHYSLAQRRCLDIIEKSKCIPVIRYYTASEVKAQDKTVMGKVYLIGPEIAGQAATPHVQRAVGAQFNVAHINEKAKAGTRMYLKTWYDGSDPTPRMCKSAFPAMVYDGNPAWIDIPWPAPSNRPWGVGEYLTLLEQMQQKAKGLYGKPKVEGANANNS